MNSYAAGKKIYELLCKLYPICRSITGNGTRQTLAEIKAIIPIETHEVPTGTKVFDWAIPKEWNIKDGYVKNSKGEKILDFQKSNLHVLNYSAPVHAKLSLKELQKHLYFLEEYPDWIPYVTSYYKENWGFALPYRQYKTLPDDTYEVFIDSELKDGNLSYGELYVPGAKKDEILLSTYICHPSLANDNLSGIALAAFLAKHLMQEKRTYSYRFLFIPETIGAIAWLCRNENKIKNIRHGLVITCVGDQGKFTYKKSRQGNAEIDKAAEKALADLEKPYEIIDFFPSGSDERQFCSPAFNLQVGSLMKTPYGRFPEYHTSADDLAFVQPQYLEDTFNAYLQTLFIIENNGRYLNLNPKCEPQLGKRGLYHMIGTQKENAPDEFALLWVLNLSDGNYSLLDISVRSGLTFSQIKNAADVLVSAGLLQKIENKPTS
ncbi:MAG: DUF4910 domain-containing protein [Candidatus Wildermuthbacteria bacterium]|nr:DUF4910 domain-containing protein [Candidatus Wildermuthbacteria bacterium]